MKRGNKIILIILLILIKVSLYSQQNYETKIKTIYGFSTYGSYINFISFKKDTNNNAKDFFNNNWKSIGLNGNQDMHMDSIEVDELGFKHFTFKQSFKGIEIYGASYKLHEYKGNLKTGNGHLVIDIKSNISEIPKHTEREALNIILDSINRQKYSWEPDTNQKNEIVPKGELVFLKDKNDEHNLILSYRFVVRTIEPMERTYICYIDANNGEILYLNPSLIFDDCHNGSVNTVFNGQQTITTSQTLFNNYLTHDKCRGDGIKVYYFYYQSGDLLSDFYKDSDNIWNNPHPASTVLWGLEMAYDYYYYTFNRNSVDGQGKLIEAWVNTPDMWQNSAWLSDDKVINFGLGGESDYSDYPVSIDVIGHEFSHGVIEYTSHLGFSYDPLGGPTGNESSALAEGFADILGTQIEFYAQGGIGDYMMMEDYKTPRNYSNPLPDYPDTYGVSPWVDVTNCIPNPQTNDNCYCHRNSTVLSYWFYLLSVGKQGTNGNGVNFNVAAIGRNKVANIVYRSLKYYITSWDNYSDVKNSTILATIDLYGECSNEVVQVIKAWDAVGVTSLGGLRYDVNTNADCEFLNYILQSVNLEILAINNIVSNCNFNTSCNKLTLGSGNSIRLTTGFKSGNNFRAYHDFCLDDIQLKSGSEMPNDEAVNVEGNPSSVQNIEKAKEGITIIPNPNNGNFAIKCVNIEGEKDVYVYSPLAVLLHKQTSLEDLIVVNVSNLAKGIYTVQVKTKDKIFNKRIVKSE